MHKCEKCGLNGYETLDAVNLFGNVRCTLCRPCNRAWDVLVNEDPRWDEVRRVNDKGVYYDLQATAGVQVSLTQLQELSDEAADLKIHFKTKALAYLEDNHGSD